MMLIYRKTRTLSRIFGATAHRISYEAAARVEERRAEGEKCWRPGFGIGLGRKGIKVHAVKLFSFGHEAGEGGEKIFFDELSRKSTLPKFFRFHQSLEGGEGSLGEKEAGPRQIPFHAHELDLCPECVEEICAEAKT